MELIPTPPAADCSLVRLASELADQSAGTPDKYTERCVTPDPARLASEVPAERLIRVTRSHAMPNYSAARHHTTGAARRSRPVRQTDFT